jgi:hypothetical protein
MVAVDPLLHFLVGRAMVSSLLLDSMRGRLLLTVRAWVARWSLASVSPHIFLVAYVFFRITRVAREQLRVA